MQYVFHSFLLNLFFSRSWLWTLNYFRQKPKKWNVKSTFCNRLNGKFCWTRTHFRFSNLMPYSQHGLPIKEHKAWSIAHSLLCVIDELYVQVEAVPYLLLTFTQPPALSLCYSSNFCHFYFVVYLVAKISEPRSCHTVFPSAFHLNIHAVAMSK